LPYSSLKPPMDCSSCNRLSRTGRVSPSIFYPQLSPFTPLLSDPCPISLTSLHLPYTLQVLFLPLLVFLHVPNIDLIHHTLALTLACYSLSHFPSLLRIMLIFSKQLMLLLPCKWRQKVFLKCWSPQNNQCIQCHIQEDRNIHQYNCDNLKS